MKLLTGPIGSGKSVVARILRLRGFGVFDCDIEARNLMQTAPELIKSVREIAGEDIYSTDGLLDRRRLAGIIFSDEEMRRKINSAVHSAVGRRIKEWLSESPANIFVETAIPVSSGLSAMAEQIWLVEALPAVRLQRILERDMRPIGEIEAIMEAQDKEFSNLKSLSVPILSISNQPDNNLLTQIDNYLKITNC